MRRSSQKRLFLPVVSLLVTALSLPVQAQDQSGPGGHPGNHVAPPARPQAPMARTAPGPAGPGPGAMRPAAPGPVAVHPGGPGVVGSPGHGPGPAAGMGRPPGYGGPGPAMAGRGPGVGPGAGPARGADVRFTRGAVVARDFGGHAYRGRVGWEAGRWRHAVHNGRSGWWWDVGGVWYYYPQPMEGPPAYISEDYADDVVYAPAAAYEAAPVEYEAEPSPPADPGASAIGGAIVGGVLGGLLTGRAGGAAAGAVIGGATGAIAGATAAARPGYYVAEGNCYYRYPSGEYVAVDPRSCY